MEDADPIFVTYHDTTLHRSDYNILQSNGWLSDRLIAFWFEHLTHEVYKEFDSVFLFMDPNMVFMIRFSEQMEDLRECLAPLKVEEKGLIFIPVNNNADIDSAGGSHWALLVYRRETGKFEYYDSYNLSNLSSARAIATKIQPLLDPTRSKVKVKKMTTPQQQNGYDCGMFVCAISECLAKKELGQSSATLKDQCNPTNVKQKRKQMADLALELKLKKDSAGGGLMSLKKKNK